jgi:hypothetical protein
MLDPSALPQSAQDHLFPFLVLGCFFTVGIIAIIVVVLKAVAASDERTRQTVSTALGAAEFWDKVEHRAIKGAAAAFTGMAEPITASINRIQESLKDHGKRLGDLEIAQRGAEVILQDVREQGRKMTALERGWLRVVAILKRNKLTDGEEVGT